MDISAIILYKILESKDLNTWSKVKLAFLDSAYSSIYAVIARHYETYSSIFPYRQLQGFCLDEDRKR